MAREEEECDRDDDEVGTRAFSEWRGSRATTTPSSTAAEVRHGAHPERGVLLVVTPSTFVNPSNDELDSELRGST